MSEFDFADRTPPADADLVDATFGAPEATTAKDTTVRRGSSGLLSSSTKSLRLISPSQSGQSLRRLSFEIFTATLKMFQRTSGQAGASMETLRGQTGADFEGLATVYRSVGGSSMELFDCSGLLCGLKKKHKLHFLLIKGYHCFVFDDEESTSPRYAIELMNRKAFIGTLSMVPRPLSSKVRFGATYTTIHLETNMGDVDYKFTFSDGSLASKFCDAVKKASIEAMTDQARKRLGHEQLIGRRASVRFAQTIGAAKVKEQPRSPFSVTQTLAGMPSTRIDY